MAAPPGPEAATQAPAATPPPPVTGLTLNNAYDGRVNLWWAKSTAGDFDHYNIYASTSKIKDVTGLAPIHQERDIAAAAYQATGLTDGARYYFAVTAAGKNGNENSRAISAAATPTPMPEGTGDPELQVDIYQPGKVWAGTTLLPDNHNPLRPRIIEVNTLGEVTWEYPVPQALRQFTNPGFDVELLANNNILFVLPRNGVYEVDRSGRVVWSYLTGKISHDADRLPDGNTIFVFGANDGKEDAQVTEVNPEGKVVWSWHASEHFNKTPYDSAYSEGWTHANSVTRLPGGNTLVSLRNFNLVAEVDPRGTVVRTIGEGVFSSQHDPEVLASGNILAANQARPPAGFHQAVEVIPATGQVAWRSPRLEMWALPARDADRLPNGNTLVTGSTAIFEFTPGGEVAWQLRLKGVAFDVTAEQGRKDASGLGFYKAYRIASR